MSEISSYPSQVPEDNSFGMNTTEINYRHLTPEETATLEDNGCKAEDWNGVMVSIDGFDPKFIHRVSF